MLKKADAFITAWFSHSFCLPNSSSLLALLSRFLGTCQVAR